MKKTGNINFPILFATIYLFVYLIVLYFSLNFRLALLMLSLSPIVLIWMVIRILKGEYTCTKTFDESFYEDYSGKPDDIK
jgi:ABC-type multidrug transport system fused ATPase/permease subunit